MNSYSHSFRAMNTGVELKLVPQQPLSAHELQEILTDVELLFQHVEGVGSRFRPDSELSQLNAAEGREVGVSPLLFDLLTAALAAYEETQGLFHPGLLTQLTEAGYDKSLELLEPSAEEAHFTCDAPSAMAPFTLDAARKTVQAAPGVQLDLGGIAKGWTVDLAAGYLRQLGHGFVNAGGDLHVFGRRANPWKIGVMNPFAAEEQVGVLNLRHGAVATSSTYKRRWQKGARWLHHLLDPRTGRPTDSEIVSATVVAPSAVQADVWAKTVLLLGADAGTDFIRQRGARAVLIDQHQHVRSVAHDLV
ncbi:thiamine biosynthesis lipoprotein [Tumebacillus sp. BK434]|uniref:FAD:protein FMN transferase n=1 Tax=Tumebacillus sp. BK434 TaxID=2512169 RepID=UPI0010D6BACD|nr:FAD:protein FMN transferase [Tumebacillus sp. BK434]TCP52184.1 thiamine biosynthesis lipoprotein [Tumebacillus sp. BK434]